MSTFGDRAARHWSSLYTGGLPTDVAQRRQEELASDLHEHASWGGVTSAQQAAVLGRVLWGIPADLSWRRAARAPRVRRLETGASMTLRKTTTVVVALYAAFNVWAGIGIIGGGYWLWGLPLLAAAGLLVLGIRQRDDAPRRSTVTIIAGAAVPAAVMYWMAPIFVPVLLLVAWLTIASEPGRRLPAPAV